MPVITLEVRATVAVQFAQRFGHQTVAVHSATEVEVLDEVSQGYRVLSDTRRKTQLHERVFQPVEAGAYPREVIEFQQKSLKKLTYS